MNVRTFSILVAAAFGLGFNGAATAADTTVNAQTPNYYECTGKGVSLTYIVGSKAEVGIVAPETTLSLELGKKKTYSFKGAEIETESTLIGDLQEVTLEHIPDLHIKHASVVIPRISLGDEAVSFKSQLILTTVETPFIAGPYIGVTNPSRYIDLACTASLVYF
jgi:hypothetical protein